MYTTTTFLAKKNSGEWWCSLLRSAGHSFLKALESSPLRVLNVYEKWQRSEQECRCGCRKAHHIRRGGQGKGHHKSHDWTRARMNKEPTSMFTLPSTSPMIPTFPIPPTSLIYLPLHSHSHSYIIKLWQKPRCDLATSQQTAQWAQSTQYNDTS